VNEPFPIPTLGWSVLAVLTAYLAGSIPWGYLIARWAKGIDIRTVGSGNLGATNVGRTLGFRFFLLVLVLDLLKGFLPTYFFPLLVSRLAGSCPVDLPVLVAASAILGHTFPVYLRFRGGKGVATSLGGLLALDPVSCGVAAAVFGGVLLVSRFVSLSSLAGGLGFVVAHFVRQAAPFDRAQLSMSVFSLAMLALLIVRHRANLARIRDGTESRVNLRWPGPKVTASPHERGRAAPWVVLGLAVLSLGVLGAIRLYQAATQPIEVTAGPWRLREIDRASTGQQRVDRVVFAPGGMRLAVACPRYERVLIYEIDARKKLKPIKEIELEGRPVAVAALGNRFVVLERPSGDQRHLEPGWWETFDQEGARIGARTRAGYYPDDLAVSISGTHLFILSSGRSEGDAQKPLPALEVVALDPADRSSRTVGRLSFHADDDPERLMLSASGRYAAVLLAKRDESAAVDLSTPESPRLIGRSKLPKTDVPYLSYSDDNDWIMMPVSGQSEALALDLPGTERATQRVGATATASTLHPGFLLCARQRESVLELVQCAQRFSLGRYPLRGPLNLGRTRPTGLCYAAERDLVAVATRSGTIHLVELVARVAPDASDVAQLAGSRSDASRR
jgi:glycerol-3-phosphate acyltransferase PlsY